MTDEPTSPLPNGQPPDSTTPSLKTTDAAEDRPGDTTRADDPLSRPADAFPGYHLLRELGRGGQGIVYQAIQTRTKRKVALKSLRPKSFDSESAVRRFQREIEVVAQLNHPNIISILHADVVGDGRKFYAMEYVRGESLNDYVSIHHLKVHAILKLFVKICDAAAYAHERGVIHRDLKPGNILVDADGEPHILDFGLAKFQLTTAETWVSASNQLVGTLPYMSPEQLSGNPDRIDKRTDVYAIGIMLFHCLTGQFPFQVTGDPASTMSQILSGISKRPSEIRRELGDEIDTIVGKCLALESERRYPTAVELAQDLHNLIEGRPIQAKRDSVAYVVRSRLRFLVQRQRPLAFLAAGLMAFAVSVAIVRPMIRDNASIDGHIVGPLTALASNKAGSGVLSHVRIITLTDMSPLEEIARNESLTGYDANVIESARLLHGRLMSKLARVRPGVVCWDIQFPTRSDYDGAFVEGIAALKQKDVPVVVAVQPWWVNESGVPLMSDVIHRAATAWGSFQFGSAHVPWRIPLTLQRGVRDAMPSLSLAAVAAFRQPGADASYVIQTDKKQIAIRYRSRWPARWIDQTDTVAAGLTLDEPEDIDHTGIKRGDRVTYHLLDMPPEAAVRAVEHEYADVLAATDAELANWFNGRIVVVADLRAGKDRHPYPNRNSVPGCYGHAAAMDQLLNQLVSPVKRTPWITEKHADTAVCSALGLLVALAPRGRRRLLLAAVALLMIGAMFYLAIEHQVIWNPVAPIAALLLAGTLGAAVRRQTFVIS